jgi:hypothetical protein
MTTSFAIPCVFLFVDSQQPTNGAVSTAGRAAGATA